MGPYGFTTICSYCLCTCCLGQPHSFSPGCVWSSLGSGRRVKGQVETLWVSGAWLRSDMLPLHTALAKANLRTKTKRERSPFHPWWGRRSKGSEELKPTMWFSTVKKWQWWQMYLLVVINRIPGLVHSNTKDDRNYILQGRDSVNTSAVHPDGTSFSLSVI